MVASPPLFVRHPARGGNVIQLPATASVPAAGRKLRS